MNDKLENIKLKKQLSQYREVAGFLPYLDDGTIKGGYRIVKSIQERDAIDQCHRKIGMIVSIQESETEYINYRLVDKDTWIEVDSDGVAGPPGPEGPEGPEGPPGEDASITIINFEIDENMHLILELETNLNMSFNLSNNGHLILT